MNLDLTEAQRVLACLGDPSRFRIVAVLADGDRCVTEIAVQVGLSQSCTTRHLQVLLRRDIVARVRQGKRVLFHLRDDDPAMALLLEWALLRSPGAGRGADAGDGPDPHRGDAEWSPSLAARNRDAAGRQADGSNRHADASDRHRYGADRIRGDVRSPMAHGGQGSEATGTPNGQGRTDRGSASPPRSIRAGAAPRVAPDGDDAGADTGADATPAGASASSRVDAGELEDYLL